MSRTARFEPVMVATFFLSDTGKPFIVATFAGLNLAVRLIQIKKKPE